MLKHKDYFSAFVAGNFDQYLERQRYCQYIVLFSTNWMAGNQTSGATSLKRSLCTMLLSFHLFFSLCLFLFVLSFLVLCVLSGFLRRLYYFYYVFVIKLFVFLSLRHFCSLFFICRFLTFGSSIFSPFLLILWYTRGFVYVKFYIYCVCMASWNIEWCFKPLSSQEKEISNWFCLHLPVKEIQCSVYI